MTQETLNEEEHLDNNQETLVDQEDEITTQDQEDNSQAEQEENVETDEERKARRKKEQENGWKAKADKTFEIAKKIAVDNASKDVNSLIEVHKLDPKLANAVAKEFGYSSYDACIKASFPKSDSSDKDNFEEWYTQRRSKEEHERSLSIAESLISKLPDDLQEEAKEYFDEITEGKTLTESKAIKFAEMATLYVNKDRLKTKKKEEALNQFANESSTKGKKVVEAKDDQMVRLNGQRVPLSSINK